MPGALAIRRPGTLHIRRADEVEKALCARLVASELLVVRMAAVAAEAVDVTNLATGDRG